jgi:S-layer homology domain
MMKTPSLSLANRAAWGIAIAMACGSAAQADPGARDASPPPAAVSQSATPAPAAARFADVPANHWAYAALQQLQADGLVDGYPGGYFKGQRPLTRYEAAAIVARVVTRLEGELSAPASAQNVSSADVAAVRRLLDEFGGELQAVKRDVAALKEQTAANTAATAANTNALARQQFHLDYLLRAPGAYHDSVSAFTAAGASLPSGAQVIGPNVGIGPQQLSAGETAHGTGYQSLRLLFSGALDAKTSYAIRLEDRYYFDNTSGNGGTLGDSTSSTTPGAGSFPNNGLLRINYAALTYQEPSGIYARVGRFLESGGDIGLAYNDYFNGAEVGFHSASRRVNGFAGYSFNRASVGNAAPYNGQSSQTLFGRLATSVGAKGSLGVNLVNDTAFYGGGPTVFNPATLRYQTVGTNLTVGSVDAGYAFGKNLSVAGEYAHRFGANPLTGSGWNQADAYWAKGLIGSTQTTGSNYVDLGYIHAGLNSTSVHNSIEENAVGDYPTLRTGDYQQFFLNNPNGYNIVYLGAHHLFSERARIGLVYQAYGLHTAIPIDSYFFGSGAARVVTPCLGCVIQHDDGRALFVETRLSF